MSKIEILAPVGSEEMLHAAVFSGADAVYLGFSGFNARTSAGNFDADSLKEAVRFCHVRGVKVHVALNTTVYGTELAQLADAVRAAAVNPAMAIGIFSRVGSLEPGKDADLVLWTADPLTTIGAEAYCTIVDGKVVYQAE